MPTNDRDFQIAYITDHAFISPEHIKAISNIRSRNVSDALLFLIQYPAGQKYVVSTKGRICGDVRAETLLVQAAFCRVTGMSRKAMAAHVEAWKKEQAAEQSEQNAQELKDLAYAYGFEITLTKKED